MLWMSPTLPRSTSPFFFFAVIILPSIPQKPTALPPTPESSLTKSLLTLPASTICTISAVSSSVYLSPLINLLSLPTLLSISFISGPPPCTSTTFTPTSESKTMSFMTALLSSSLSIALPPYLTTIILSLYFCIYGSALTSVSACSALSVSVICLLL